MAQHDQKHKSFLAKLVAALAAVGAGGSAVSSASHLRDLFQGRRKLGNKEVVLACACGGMLVGSLAAGQTFHSPAEDSSTQPSSVYSLFECSPCDDYGAVGCTQNNPGKCNTNCASYTSSTSTGIKMTAGPDCHTVNSHSACTFTIGDKGVTQVDFDFVVTDACHQTVDTTEWLAFWIYSKPWSSTVEVDFIESLNGPRGKNGGLNENFAGNGKQVLIFKNTDLNWSGHITAKFSGSGSNVMAKTTFNGQSSKTASSTLTTDGSAPGSGYFFVMDTALGSGGNTQCSFTISNLKLKGTVPAGQCTGVVVK